jgi:hypothetical protein
MNGMETLCEAAQVLEDEDAEERARAGAGARDDAPARARRQRKMNSRYYARDYVASEGGARGAHGASRDQVGAQQTRPGSPRDDPDKHKVAPL